MKTIEISASNSPFSDLMGILEELHETGPVSSDILETLGMYKFYHPETFRRLESRIISALGLFYKVRDPSDLYSFILGAIGRDHQYKYGALLTPVQASVRRAVENMKFVSISAPTSAGKSYSIRDFIAEQTGDAVVVVPSRALIAEYVAVMKEKFSGDKTVMISAFVDNVFTSRHPRRIFVLTPERARDLFSADLSLDIRVFFFDEAQISEEPERGVIFDVLVRRVKVGFPEAKLIFAHPFVCADTVFT